MINMQKYRFEYLIPSIGVSSLLGSAIAAFIGCINTCGEINDPLNQILSFFGYAVLISLLVGFTIGLLYAATTIFFINKIKPHFVLVIIAGTIPILLAQFYLGENAYIFATIYCSIATFSFLLITTASSNKSLHTDLGQKRPRR